MMIDSHRSRWNKQIKGHQIETSYYCCPLIIDVLVVPDRYLQKYLRSVFYVF